MKPLEAAEAKKKQGPLEAAEAKSEGDRWDFSKMTKRSFPAETP